MAYAAFATVTCVAVALFLRARRDVSPLVAADVENWTVNAAVSGGVLAGFAGAAVLERAGLAGAARHVDPAMVALVVLGTIAVPLRMAGGGLRALLNRGPAAPVAAGMEALAREALGDLPIRRLYIRAVQPGRTAYIAVHVLLPTDAGSTSPPPTACAAASSPHSPPATAGHRRRRLHRRRGLRRPHRQLHPRRSCRATSAPVARRAPVCP